MHWLLYANGIGEFAYSIVCWLHPEHAVGRKNHPKSPQSMSRDAKHFAQLYAPLLCGFSITSILLARHEIHMNNSTAQNIKNMLPVPSNTTKSIYCFGWTFYHFVCLWNAIKNFAIKNKDEINADDKSDEMKFYDIFITVFHACMLYGFGKYLYESDFFNFKKTLNV
jgi:hypothetical protein